MSWIYNSTIRWIFGKDQKGQNHNDQRDAIKTEALFNLLSNATIGVARRILFNKFSDPVVRHETFQNFLPNCSNRQSTDELTDVVVVSYTVYEYSGAVPKNYTMFMHKGDWDAKRWPPVIADSEIRIVLPKNKITGIHLYIQQDIDAILADSDGKLAYLKSDEKEVASYYGPTLDFHKSVYSGHRRPFFNMSIWF